MELFQSYHKAECKFLQVILKYSCRNVPVCLTVLFVTSEVFYPPIFPQPPTLWRTTYVTCDKPTTYVLFESEAVVRYVGTM